ncbi:MAG: ABC transporter permease subunit [Ferruginibacter sp.]|nr:ABC transporter permease subunit [Ferruginibacter sp.]
MKNLKSFFEPFGIVSKSKMMLLVFMQIVFVLGVWQWLGGGLIPSPGKIGLRILEIIKSGSFWDNFMMSLILTLKGMFFALIIALAISYLSLVPFFRPLAKFVIKCRYLTLTGLIFLFTLLTSDGSQLKLSLLLFGIVPFFVTSLLSVIDGIDKQEYELCSTLGMHKWRTLWEVIIIGRLDQVFEVMRQNFAIAWMMITMVEGLSMSEGGLGAMLIKSNKYIDLATVFSILVIIFFIGVFFDYLLGALRYSFFPYTKIQLRNK